MANSLSRLTEASKRSKSNYTKKDYSKRMPEDLRKPKEKNPVSWDKPAPKPGRRR